MKKFSKAKKNNYVWLGFLASLFITPLSWAEIPSEQMIRDYLAEETKALEESDFETWAKVFNEDTDILMDMDPDPERGQRELDYEKFVQVAKIYVQGLEAAQVEQTIEAFDTDIGTQARLVTVLTRVESDLLGMRMEKVVRSKRGYGLKEGELFLISYEENVEKSAVINQ